MISSGKLLIRTVPTFERPFGSVLNMTFKAFYMYKQMKQIPPPLMADKSGQERLQMLTWHRLDGEHTRTHTSVDSIACKK